MVWYVFPVDTIRQTSQARINHSGGKTSKRWSDRDVQDNHWQGEGSSRRFLQLPSVQLRSTRSLLQTCHTAQPIRSETGLLQPRLVNETRI